MCRGKQKLGRFWGRIVTGSRYVDVAWMEIAGIFVFVFYLEFVREKGEECNYKI